MDFAVLFAPLGTGATDAVVEVLPIALPVLVLLAGITIVLRVFGKVGVRR